LIAQLIARLIARPSDRLNARVTESGMTATVLACFVAGAWLLQQQRELPSAGALALLDLPPVGVPVAGWRVQVPDLLPSAVPIGALAFDVSAVG
jgi:hypothetical protein